MMPRHLQRIAPTLLALGMLPIPAFAGASTNERDNHLEIVKSLISNELRLPAKRQLAEFAAAGYPDAAWQGKFLAWFYADRFRVSTPDPAETADLEAKAKALLAELEVAAKDGKLPPALKSEFGGAGQATRMLNDLLKVIGPDTPPPKLGKDAIVPEQRATLNATIKALPAVIDAAFTEVLARIAEHEKVEASVQDKPDNDPKYQAVARTSVELRQEAMRLPYLAMRVLREVAYRGEQDCGLDPAPVLAWITAFSGKYAKTFSDWSFAWGDWDPSLRLTAAELCGQAARVKVPEISLAEVIADFQAIIDLDLAVYSSREARDVVRNLQIRAYAGLLALYRELGKTDAKYYREGENLIKQYQERSKAEPSAFRADHPNRERAIEVGRFHIQAGRLLAAKGDANATLMFGAVSKARGNPLAGNAAGWASGGGGGSTGSWGDQAVAADPMAAITAASALSRAAREHSDPVQQRRMQVAAAVTLRNGVLGLSSSSFPEASLDEYAPELWYRYAEALSRMDMRWHAAVAAQAGLAHIDARTTALKGKTPWKDKDGAWTARGRFISTLARNAIVYASALPASARSPSSSAFYSATIDLVNKVSPGDGGKSLDRTQILILLSEKRHDEALSQLEAYAKKYPDEAYDADSLRSTIRMGQYDKATTEADKAKFAELGAKEARATAERAKQALAANPPAERRKVLNRAIRDVQATDAFFSLRRGQEEQVIAMLGADYWTSPPDEDKSVQMLGYLCQAVKQWYEAQIKDAKAKADPQTVLRAWDRVWAAYEIWGRQKARLPAQSERIENHGKMLAWVFQNITNQTRAMLAVEAPPAGLAAISTQAQRAFADLFYPRLTEESKPEQLLYVAGLLWDLGDQERAGRLYEFFIAQIAQAPAVAVLRDTPKEAWADIEPVLQGRPELRALWAEVKDLLEDSPELSKKILDLDLPESQWGEKKRDYGAAVERIRVLRAEMLKSKNSLAADYAKVEDGLQRLSDTALQLFRQVNATAKLAEIYRGQGLKDKANEFYRWLISYDPTNPDYLAATVELTIDLIKNPPSGAPPVTKEQAEATRVKAARVRGAAPGGSTTYWTAAIQVLELSVYVKDVGLVNRALQFDGINKSTPADDLQVFPRNPRDDPRVRRARNSLAVDLARRYLDIFKQPGVTAKPTYAVTSVEVDGQPMTLFVPVDGPRFVPVRRVLDDDTVTVFLWEEGKDPPPEPAAEPAPAPAPAPAPPAAETPPAPAAEAAPAPAPASEAKP